MKFSTFETNNLIMKKLLLITFLACLSNHIFAQDPKRLYLANDTHVDLMYNGTEAEWDQKIIDMADFYLKLGEATKDDKDPARRSKWNYDCAYWLYTLEKKTPPAYFARIIDQIKRQQASVPYNFTLPIYGASTPESVLRSFYFGGYLERKYGIDVDIAVCQENATVPLGLASLWAGSGAKYSWKGVCDCASKVKSKGVRNHEIYYYKGMDGQQVLMKWYSLMTHNAQLGGYSETLEPSIAAIQLDTLSNSKRYPYRIAGAFGKGWDNMVNYSYDMVWHLDGRTRPGTKLFLSNELDFFKDFEQTYGSKLPSETLAYGNEWDLLPASLTSVSSGIRRSMEKLRTAEAMAAVVVSTNPKVFDDLKPLKEKFLYGISVISAHGWTIDGPTTKRQFADWAKLQQKNIAAYVDALHQRAAESMAKITPTNAGKTQIFVFNSLAWERSQTADFEWDGKDDIAIKDIKSSRIVQHQMIQKNGKKYIRFWAEKVPSVGYKTYEILEKQAIVPFATNDFILKNQVLETPYYKLKFTKQGVITSLVEKISGRELVKAENGKYFNDLGTGLEDTKGKFSLKNIGALSATLSFEGSDSIKTTSAITFFTNSPKIEFENEILTNFGSKPTYWTYSLNIKESETIHEEVGAIIKADYQKDGGNYAEKFSRVDHLSSNHFVDVQSNTGGALLSNADCLFMKLGNSDTQKLDAKSAQLNMLVGGQIDANYKLGIVNQDGDTYFQNNFSLLPHIGKMTNAASMKFALEHQNPMFVGKALGSNQIATERSFWQTSNPNVLLWVLKPGEDGGIVARTWHLGDSPDKAQIQFGFPIKKASQTTHVETPIVELPIQNNVLSISSKQQEIQTFRVEF
jgi:alpha-mannosidase